MTEENQKLLKQANEAKSRELEASQKVEKIQSENIKLKLEQIEELKKEVKNLKFRAEI